MKVDQDMTVALHCLAKGDVSTHRYRSVTVDKKTNKHILGVPHCQELAETDTESIDKINVSNYDVYESHEGTIIRVFYMANQWYTSTSRKLDAFESKWASQTTTFGESFANALCTIVNDVLWCTKEAKYFLTNFYESHLNKNMQYVFLLKPTEEERVVCKSDGGSVLFVGILNDENHLNMDATLTIQGQLIPKPEKRPEILSPDSLYYHLLMLDTSQLQGFLLVNKTDTLEHLKIYTSHYADLAELRSNTPSLGIRYMQLLAVENEQKLHQFKRMYSNSGAVFRTIDRHLHEAGKWLMFMFSERYYMKNTHRLPYHAHRLITLIHAHYVTTGIKTTCQTIQKMLLMSGYKSVSAIIDIVKELNSERTVKN